MAPQAQNAHWKPLVSAAAGAAPWWSRVLAWVAAIVDATATPIAPPSCWEVLRSPEGKAGLVLGDPSQGGDRDWDEGKRGTDSDDDERSGQTGPVVPVHGHLGCPQHAAADHGHAGCHHEPGQAAGDQRLRQ